MKKNFLFPKLLSLLLVIVLTVGMLVSCGSEVTEIPSEPSGSTAAGLDASAAASQGKIVTTMRVTAFSDNFDEDYNTLKTQLVALGGYIATSQYEYDEYDGKTLTATLKIPADKSAEFTNSFSAYLNITSSSVTTEDLTVSYIDVESRIKALEAEIETVTAMFEQETNYDNVLKLSDHLSKLITELEKAKALLAEYDKRTAYSTVYLTLIETEIEEEAEEEGFFKSIGSTFARSFLGVVEFFGDLTVFFIGNLPTFLALGIIPVGIIAIVKLSKKRRAKKRKAKPTPPPMTPPPQAPYPPYYAQRPPMGYPYPPTQTPPQTPPAPPAETPTENKPE